MRRNHCADEPEMVRFLRISNFIVFLHRAHSNTLLDGEENSMRILIAEDNLVSRKLLDVALKKWGYDVVAVNDGKAAWEELQKADAPKLVILDWNMPEMDGLKVCRRLRESDISDPPYVILLTARDNKDDIVQGLEAGANDYVTKPFHNAELRARVRVGHRMVEMKEKLAAQVLELRKALEHIKTLQGIIPICSFCKRIRDDQGYWNQVEAYLSRHSEARFSHGFCPDCVKEHYPDFAKRQVHDESGKDQRKGTVQEGAG